VPLEKQELIILLGHPTSETPIVYLKEDAKGEIRRCKRGDKKLQIEEGQTI
jgi:hypothetical protein